MYYMDNLPTYKLVVVGDCKTGKTSLIKRLLTGRFNANSYYWPTIMHTEQDLVFQTKRGPVRFNVFDTTGEHKHPVLGRMYHRGSDCAIIMCDLTDEETCDNVVLWNTQLWNDCGRIPTVICGNKAGDPNRTVFKFDPTICKSNMQYFDISVSSNYCCSEPFIHLYYQLMGERFHFVTLLPPNGLAAIQEADEPQQKDDRDCDCDNETHKKEKDNLDKKNAIIEKVKKFLKEKNWALGMDKAHCEEDNKTLKKDSDDLEEQIVNNE
ncbi:GTP-binding nuclear protein ran-1-like [Drosophila obscura]|uniref:GTP-binding nuclear protein ran-1-like n=1 Tax=Drosophila obscura TaxID=7282 RepID=UPI001BB174D2|nr:GTP-binding nuclear protein ran-1-like [Drosophila obscura]